MLRVTNLNAYYGNIHSLKGISFHIKQGEIVTLIGANGAGKTTTLNAICGLITSKGKSSIVFENQNIAQLSPDKIVKLGISQVPEGRLVLKQLSVLDNLLLGAYIRYKKEKKSVIKQDIDWIYDLFPRLLERKDQMAGTLSGGEQQMLAIGRALMSKPKLLLLDEPSMGLAPKITQEIFRKIVDLNKNNTTILLVEQNAKIALGICDRGYVLETGKIITQGPKDELYENKDVQRAYLGKGYKEVWE